MRKMYFLIYMYVFIITYYYANLLTHDICKKSHGE